MLQRREGGSVTKKVRGEHYKEGKEGVLQRWEGGGVTKKGREGVLQRREVRSVTKKASYGSVTKNFNT